MVSFLRRFGPGLLVAAGAILIISALVNLASVMALFKPVDAAAFFWGAGARTEIIAWYGAGLAAGALMVSWGPWRRSRRAP